MLLRTVECRELDCLEDAHLQEPGQPERISTYGDTKKRDAL
jgi:hypothetical protein